MCDFVVVPIRRFRTSVYKQTLFTIIITYAALQFTRYFTCCPPSTADRRQCCGVFLLGFTTLHDRFSNFQHSRGACGVRIMLPFFATPALASRTGCLSPRIRCTGHRPSMTWSFFFFFSNRFPFKRVFRELFTAFGKSDLLFLSFFLP